MEKVIKRLSHHEFEELHVLESPTVCRECPKEAAEAVKDLRNEIRALQEDLAKWKFRYEYAEQLLIKRGIAAPESSESA